MSEIYDITKRTGKQCRERWISNSNSVKNKIPWMPEDDEMLFLQQKKFGTRWSELAKCFFGRYGNVYSELMAASKIGSILRLERR